MDEATESRRLQNSLVAVNALSEDVLLEIFWHCKNFPASQTMRDVRWFLWISHVCWLWRRITCDASYLWRIVPNQNLQLACLFLKRSKSCSVDVTLPIRAPVSQLYMKNILDHLGRVRHLRVDFTERQWHTQPQWLLAAICACQAPLLKTLHYSNLSSRLKIPCSPALCELLFEKCRLHEGWRFPSSVRSIVLKKVVLPAAADVLASFGALPDVSRLVLDRIACSHGPLDGVRGVVLPKLASLEIRMISKDTLLFLLQHMDCPQLQTLDIRMGDAMNQIDASSLKTIFRSNLLGSFIHRLPKERYGSCVRIHNRTVMVSVDITTHAGKCVRVLNLDFRWLSTHEADRFPMAVFDANDLRVQDLEIEMPRVSKETWARVLDLCSDTLTKVTASHDPVTVANLALALNDDMVHQNMIETAAISQDFGPRLAEIEVCSVSLDAATAEGRLADLIKMALTTRARRGHRLHKLRLFCCKAIPNTFIEELKSGGAITLVEEAGLIY
jgi:hypothetical protein